MIQRLEPSQWRTALRLRVDALTESPEAFGSTVSRERELGFEDWRARLTENAWFVAFEGDTAVGLACGIRTTPPDELELTAMWIAPSHRGVGLGDALIGAVRDWASQEEALRLALSVGGTNDSAIRLYTRHGFTVVEATNTSGHPNREGDLRMHLVLRPEIPISGRQDS